MLHIFFCQRTLVPLTRTRSLILLYKTLTPQVMRQVAPAGVSDTSVDPKSPMGYHVDPECPSPQGRAAPGTASLPHREFGPSIEQAG